MLRVVRRCAVHLSCLTASAWAQTQPRRARRQRSRRRPSRRQESRAESQEQPQSHPDLPESGPCRIGVISAVGDQFAVQKVGLTVFGNEETEVPVDAWGLDDLVVARDPRAAGSGIAVRRIAYAKGALRSIRTTAAAKGFLTIRAKT